MKDNTYNLMILIVWLIFGVIVGILTSYDMGYEQGQINAINGKIEYHLVEQEDKSLEWEKK